MNVCKCNVNHNYISKIVHQNQSSKFIKLVTYPVDKLNQKFTCLYMQLTSKHFHKEN